MRPFFHCLGVCRIFLAEHFYVEAGPVAKQETFGQAPHEDGSQAGVRVAACERDVHNTPHLGSREIDNRIFAPSAVLNFVGPVVTIRIDANCMSELVPSEKQLEELIHDAMNLHTVTKDASSVMLAESDPHRSNLLMSGVPKAPQDLNDLLVRPRRTKLVFPVQFEDLPDRHKFHSEHQIFPRGYEPAWNPTWLSIGRNLKRQSVATGFYTGKV